MNEILRKMIEVLGISQEKAIAELKDFAAKHPDEAERAAAIEAFIRANASPAIDPATLAATIAGIAKDVASGQTGIDPDAWAGSV